MAYNKENRPVSLAYGDEVLFEIPNPIGVDHPAMQFLYQVDHTFLNDRRSESNMRVFEYLSVDRIQVAAECYGYTPSQGSWPSFRPEDFEAATRLVNRLLDLCEGVTGINDLRAKVPFEKFLNMGLAKTLTAVYTAGHRVTPREIAEILARENVQGFSLEDVSEILYKLSELGILTFHQDATGQEVYFVDPEKKGHMEYIHATKNGLSVVLMPKDHALVPHLLKFLREAPGSVTYETLMEAFGEDGLLSILQGLVDRNLIRSWEKGYYTHPENKDEVTRIISEARI